MSEHNLSGIDFTNGRRVNLNFNTGDLFPNTNLFDSSKIAKEITDKKKSNTEKVDTFVEKVEAQNPYEKLADAYGGIEKLPADFQPIKEVTSPFNLLNLMSGTPSKKVVETQFDVKGLKPNEEIRIVPGTENDPRYFKIDKRAPGVKTLGSTFAGIIDAISGQTLDLDKMGKEFKLTDRDYIKSNLVDLTDPKNFKLSKIEQNLVNRELETQGIDTVEEDATSGVGAATDKSIEQQKKQSAFDRRERLKDTIQTQATNFATIPFYTRLLEDAAKRRLELDKAMLGAREMMPSNIQNIMLSKQSQKNLASSAFAEELKAIGYQSEIANKFGAPEATIGRRFGQA